MTLTSPKKWRIIPAKSLVHNSRENKWITKKSKTKVSRRRKNIDSQIKEKTNPHSRFTQGKNAHHMSRKKLEFDLFLSRRKHYTKQVTFQL